MLYSYESFIRYLNRYEGSKGSVLVTWESKSVCYVCNVVSLRDDNKKFSSNTKSLFRYILFLSRNEKFEYVIPHDHFSILCWNLMLQCLGHRTGIIPVWDHVNSNKEMTWHWEEIAPGQWAMYVDPQTFYDWTIILQREQLDTHQPVVVQCLLDQLFSDISQTSWFRF